MVPGVDVDVGVALHHGDLEAVALEQAADGGRGQALAQGRDDASGHEDVLGGQDHSFPCGAPEGPRAITSVSRQELAHALEVLRRVHRHAALARRRAPRGSACRGAGLGAAPGPPPARAATAAGTRSAAAPRGGRRRGPTCLRASPRATARPRPRPRSPVRRAARRGSGCARSRGRRPRASVTTFTTDGRQHLVGLVRGRDSVAMGRLGIVEERAPPRRRCPSGRASARRPARSPRSPRPVARAPPRPGDRCRVACVGRRHHRLASEARAPRRRCARRRWPRARGPTGGAAHALVHVLDHRLSVDLRERLPRQACGTEARGDDRDDGQIARGPRVRRIVAARSGAESNPGHGHGREPRPAAQQQEDDEGAGRAHGEARNEAGRGVVEIHAMPSRREGHRAMAALRALEGPRLAVDAHPSTPEPRRRGRSRVAASSTSASIRRRPVVSSKRQDATRARELEASDARPAADRGRAAGARSRGGLEISSSSRSGWDKGSAASTWVTAASRRRSTMRGRARARRLPERGCAPRGPAWSGRGPTP